MNEQKLFNERLIGETIDYVEFDLLKKYCSNTHRRYTRVGKLQLRCFVNSEGFWTPKRLRIHRDGVNISPDATHLGLELCGFQFRRRFPFKYNPTLGLHRMVRQNGLILRVPDAYELWYQDMLLQNERELRCMMDGSV